MSIWERGAMNALVQYGQGATDKRISGDERRAIEDRAYSLAESENSTYVKLYHVTKAIRLWIEETYGAADRIAFYSHNHGI
jgi:hypothetical protein